MKNRLELAKYFAELGFKTGAEIGVQKGLYSRALLMIIPNLKLYSIDCWEGKYKGSELPARECLSKYSGSVVIKGKSIDVAKEIADNALDFVYIDANHTFECASEDILAWSEKIKSGGIVSGHDYQLPDVKRAVDGYIKKRQFKLYITGDAVSPSWWFVK